MNNPEQTILKFPFMSQKQFLGLAEYLQTAKYVSGEISGIPISKPEEPRVHYIKIVVKLNYEGTLKDDERGFHSDLTNVLRLAGEIDLAEKLK